MKVKQFLRNALPNPSQYTRRGNKNGRRENAEFRRLASCELPDVHFHRSGGPSSSRSGGRQPALVPQHQFPIELENLQRASPKNNLSGKHADNEGMPFPGSNQFENNFQIYNPTSEELPQEDIDDNLPFALSDVRLAFREIISGENDDNIVPKVYSLGERDSKCDSRWYCCCFPRYSRVGKAKAIWTLATIVGLICVVAFTTLLLDLSKENYSSTNVEDSEILLNLEWPLLDISSRRNNISFSTLKKESLLQNFEMNYGDGEDSKLNEKSDYSTHSSERKKLYPGLFTLHGRFIDQTIVENSLHTARALLKEKLNENSTREETLSWKGIAMNIALQLLRTKFNITSTDDSLEGLFEEDLCDKEVELSCNKTSWFRMTDGTCNNVIHKNWGSQYAPIRRIIDPISIKAEQLPTVESVTSQLASGNTEADHETTAILPLWGMFILHDTLKTAESPVPCFNANKQIDDNGANSVTSNSDDKVCTVVPLLNQPRSSRNQNTTETMQCFMPAPCPADYPTCQIGPHTSFNLVTSYIDASNIYGSSVERMEKLRLKIMGKMKLENLHHSQRKGFLPRTVEFKVACNNETEEGCFLSGDDDINEFSALTALSTIFVRQHNVIANWLHHHNGHWSDERLFQESRRILIAQIQHITYNEFLPQILGSGLMNRSGLMLQESGFYEQYDPEVDTSVSDAFAGAVGHFWYAMTAGQLQSIWKRGKHVRKTKYNIGLQMLHPEFLMDRKSHLEAVMRGFAFLAANRVGLKFPSQLRSLYIMSLNTTVDFLSLLIEKGRALKVGPYIEWRKACGFSEVKRFKDLKEHWYAEAYSSLTSAYGNIEHIDLFTGMLAENPITSGKVGPTLACLLTDQFLRFKQGDRFWYEGDVYFHHFTESQLKTIRKTTLARILCDNTDRNFDQIQKWPMLLTSPQANPVTLCNDFEQIPNINFHFWKEIPETSKKMYERTRDSAEDSEDWDFDPEEIESEEETQLDQSQMENKSKKNESLTASWQTTSDKMPIIDVFSTSSNNSSTDSNESKATTEKTNTMTELDIRSNRTKGILLSRNVQTKTVI